MVMEDYTKNPNGRIFLIEKSLKILKIFIENIAGLVTKKKLKMLVAEWKEIEFYFLLQYIVVLYIYAMIRSKYNVVFR